MLQPGLASTNGDYGAPAAREGDLHRYCHRLLEEIGGSDGACRDTMEVILGAILTRNTT